jgi:L-lactate utilization protein LutC
MSAPEASAGVAPVPPSSPSNPSPFARVASEEQIRRTAAALEQNGIHVVLADDRAAAVKAVLDAIPSGANVLDASSQTVLSLGLPEAIAQAGHHLLKPELTRLRQESKFSEMRRLGAAPDVVVGSVHAITEAGQVLIASASGSQLGPYASTAEKVIWVVGAQKIVPDLETAFRRVQEYTLPLESARAQQAYGRPSFVAKLLIYNREFVPGRVTLVLLRENLGY